MHDLQKWMTDAGEDDLSLSSKIGVSRVQVSRIRRGITGASKETAIELERVTGIPWPRFIEPAVEPPEAPQQSEAVR